jgi:hypothetical protein
MLLQPKAIAALPDDVVEQAIFDAALGEGGQDQVLRHQTLARLPIGYQVVYTTWVVEAEVTNGGFLQYFYNWRGEYIDETMDALTRLEAIDHLKVFEVAIDRLEEEFDRLEPFWKQGTQESFAASYKVSKLRELDKKWWALGDLSAKRVAYIRHNLADFERTLDD